MHLQLFDWIIIALYCVVTLVVGLLYSSRAGRNKEEFFVAGRKLNWFFAGTSMAAASSAPDTPLVVSGLIRRGGIYENWIWWTLILSGMFTVFFFSGMWRRTGLLTDIQFISIRYSGKSAKYLRIFKVFLNLFGKCITIAWVILALYKLFSVLFKFPDISNVSFLGISFNLSAKMLYLGLLILIVLAYTVCSGMWGVVITNSLQFIVFMFGAVALAILSCHKAGGASELLQKVLASPGVTKSHISFFPSFSSIADMAILTFFVYILLQWWFNASGSSVVVQRFLACKNEKHAALAAIWGFFATVVLRSWPWIIVGLVSLIYFPLQKGEDPELIYPKMMIMFLPIGLKGLMIASFLAVFMSTVNGMLNLGASYLVNDIYIPFICKTPKSERHYVFVSRIATVLVLVFGIVFSVCMDSISMAWKYLAEIVGGASFVLIMRWYWWRVNAWSEISAMASSFIIANSFRFFPLVNTDEYFGVRFGVNIIVSTIIWITVTLLTKPAGYEHLKEFYIKIQPEGWWEPFKNVRRNRDLIRFRDRWIGWTLSVISLYSSLFGIGYLCLGNYIRGLIFLAVFFIFGRLALSKMYLILKQSRLSSTAS